MREYLEQILHQSIQEHPYESLEKLPLGCRNAFALSIVEIQKQEILIAAPIETMNLTELRKMRIQLERYTGFQCVFYLKKTNWYSVPKMVEEGIPFIWENHQIYLPFMGLLLQRNEHRKPKRCSIISFLTQKLLLKALYEGWQDVSAVQAAEKLEVSRMSITRCYDEIEALGMSFIKMNGRSRRFFARNDKKVMWEEIRPFLRNPIIHEFYHLKCVSKPKKVALGAVMRKLVNIIFAVLRDRKPFQLRSPEEHEELLFAKSLVA